MTSIFNDKYTIKLNSSNVFINFFFQNRRGFFHGQIFVCVEIVVNSGVFYFYFESQIKYL